MPIDLEAALKRVERLKQTFVVPPGKKISLRKDYDPAFMPSPLKEKEMKQLLAEGVELLAEYQARLYAQSEYAILIVLQAADAAGKDGTIKHVMSGVNPQGCDVHSFKRPSAEELSHDYLWRCALRLPERGKITIFNRSYYEEVLVARVHPEILDEQKIPREWKDKKIWNRRFEEINGFEKYLFENGIIVLKFFLNLSRREQKRRFLERIDRPEKNWKFSTSDAEERKFWKNYQNAYEDCVNHTSTKWAPWYVVPADFKPFSRIAVAGVIVKTLSDLNLQYPKVGKKRSAELAKIGRALEAE
ncbi:MAG TPA: polyphosphate kinase 2 family protein [Candidatus Binataceae bacterium]|nr:polyphosphate kinase 2 family protein [Candidatus Binataceae bacterium]